MNHDWLGSECSTQNLSLKESIILPSIKLELDKGIYYLLLDNCSTHTFLSQRLINNISFKKLDPFKLVTGPFEGSVDSRYERVGVKLGGIEIIACIKSSHFV